MPHWRKSKDIIVYRWILLKTPKKDLKIIEMPKKYKILNQPYNLEIIFN